MKTRLQHYLRRATVALMLVSGFALAADTAVNGDTGGMASLRGETNLADNAKPGVLKNPPRQQELFRLNFVHQPPLVPHAVESYQVDINFNKCMSCHGLDNHRQSGAVRISPTHMMDRDGVLLSDVSPRRYFCSQCHVPQVMSDELVENTFTPTGALGNNGQ